MKIEIDHPKEGKIVVRPQGRLDVQSAPLFKQQLRELVDSDGLIIVVDLEDVDFIDSSGLSALVSGLKALRERDGSLHICRPQPQGRTALRLTLLDRVFPIFPDLDQALKEGD